MEGDLKHRVMKAEPKSDDDVECLGYVDANGNFHSLEKMDVGFDDATHKMPINLTNDNSVAKTTVLSKTEPFSEDDDRGCKEKMLLPGEDGRVDDTIHEEQQSPSDYVDDRLECAWVDTLSLAEKEWLYQIYNDDARYAEEICRGVPEDPFPASAARQQPLENIAVDTPRIKTEPGEADEPQPSSSAVAGPSASPPKRPRLSAILDDEAERATPMPTVLAQHSPIQ